MLTRIREQTAQFLSQLIPSSEMSLQDLVGALELPKKLEHGHLALPVFALAKMRRQAPPQIAQLLVTQIQQNPPTYLQTVQAVGGFVNFTFQNGFLQETLWQDIQKAGDRLGYSTLGQGRRMVIDYSSPNVAKVMHVGHLRATMIGQAIRNLAETQGYEVIGLNHLGDWGSQFGKLAWAYMEWGKEYPFAEEPFRSLTELYVRFHREAKERPDLELMGAATFKRLEEGDAEVTRIWKMFVEISLKDYQRLWNLLGVKHDLVRGESFYNDRLKDVEARLQKAQLLVESEGAQVVHLGDEMPPCLIRKSDGASIYATRDLASAIYRHEELKADLNLYVVGVDQTLHFRQVFKVLELMGYEWAKNCHHIAFGMYRFKDMGRMSTREGNVITLEDVLKQAIEAVDRLIQEKNPQLPNRSKVAEQVGIGAITFNDLMNDRVKNVDFDWDRILDFEGDSGPYVQYTQVRCVSVLKKHSGMPAFKIDLQSTEERELVRVLLNYQDTLRASFENFKPNILAQYLLDVCRAFNHFYHKHRILGEAAEVETSRLALVQCAQKILQSGLKVLSIQSPEAM